MTETLEDRQESTEYKRLFEQEKLILEATEMLYRMMEEQNVTKADLARRISKTRGHVTQLLDGSRNMTLRTLADVAFSLGHRIELSSDSIGKHMTGPSGHAVRHLNLDDYRQRARLHGRYEKQLAQVLRPVASSKQADAALVA